MSKLIISILITIIAIIHSSIANDTSSTQNEYYTLNGKKIKYEDSNILKDYDNKIGFAASMFSGHGVSYQRHILDNYRIEITTSIYGLDNNYQRYNDFEFENEPKASNFILFSIGFEIQKVIYSTQRIKLIAFTGFSYWSDVEENVTETYDDTKPLTYSSNHNKKSYVVGLGIGGEYRINNELVIDLDLGFIYQNKITLFYDESKPLDQTNTNNVKSVLGFGIGGGVYYAF